MGYKLEALPCVSDPAGNVVRPYAVDDEIIYEISMDKFLSGNEDDIQTEINTLIEKIEGKTGVLLTHDDLAIALNEKYIDG